MRISDWSSDVCSSDLAVAPDMKATARDQVCAAVQAGGYGGRELIIRTNSLDTPWGRDDVIAAAKAGPDAVLLPKVESAEQVQVEIGRASCRERVCQYV